MALERKVVATDVYEGRCIEARHMGPDLLAYCDGMELGNFYVNSQAAFAACRRHVDAELKAEREAAVKAASNEQQAAKTKKKGRR